MIDKIREIFSGVGADAVRRKQLLVLGGVLGAVILFAVGIVVLQGPENNKPLINPQEKIPVTSVQAPGTQVDPREAWATKYEADVKEMRAQMKDLLERVKRTEDENDRLKKETKEGGNKLAKDARAIAEQKRQQDAAGQQNGNLPPLPPLPISGGSAQANANGQRPQPLPPLPGGAARPGQQGSMGFEGGIMTVQVSDAENVMTLAAAAKGKSRPKVVDSYVPSGSFSPGQLLSGLDAPTGGQAQQNPLPVLVRVTNLANLPNRYRFDVKECFVTGAGHGDLSSERAYIRLNTLSCVMKSGTVVDQAVKGFIAGPDGKAGIRGTLVSKQGSVLANALIAGIAAGIGDAFATSKTTQSVSPLGSVQTLNKDDVLEAGVGKGVDKALDRLAAYYIKLADAMFPIIEVHADTSVDIVLLEGLYFNDETASDVRPAVAMASKPPASGPATFKTPEKVNYGK